MSTRRSTRVRTATEETSGAPADTANHVDESPRKRQRSSRDLTVDSSEASTSAAATTGNSDAQDYAGTSPPIESPIKKGPGRPRGRPPKNHASNADDGAAPIVNGTAPHRETRSTRNSQVDGGASTGQELIAPQHISIKHDDDSSEHELYLDSSSSATLSTVLEQFSPDLLHLQFTDTSSSAAKARGRKKATTSVVTTLSEALDGRPMTLRRLRNIVLALRRPAVSSAAHNDASTAKTDTQRHLAAMTIVLSLIDEIARSTRQQQMIRGDFPEALAPPVKKEERCEILDNLLDGDNKQGAAVSQVHPPHKYALHMRLPTGDYFSQAVELDPEQASSLETGAADLVEIEPPPSFYPEQPDKKRQRAADVPTLASRRYRNASLRTPSESIEELRERRMGRVRPTSDVYFGPYASFAPTYDSSDANISRDTSSLVWRTKMDPVVCASRKAWHSVPDKSADEDWELVDAADAQPESQPAKTNAALDLDPSLDAGLISSLMDAAPSEAEIQARLHSNALLLDQLQDLQWARLRAGYARWKSTEKELSQRRRAPDVPEDEPGEEEQEVARELLQGLTALVQLRPREASSESTAALVPKDGDLRVLSRSVAIDPALAGPSADSTPRGYWGTLDGSTYGPQPTTAVQPPPPPQRTRSSRSNVVVPSMQTNTTARLDVKGENNSHVRKINAATRNALPPGVSGDVGGHGLLDRVMGIMGRQVAHQASVTAGVLPTQTQTQPQPQPQSSPAPAVGAMSPSAPTKMMPPPPGPGGAAGVAPTASSPPPPPPPTMATRRSFHVPTRG